ncbi:glycoside hydrolase family 88 protein [Butyrivibrio sp. FCS014]|uniref:glycoside hydrolase family 88 protein n=1 Tax=Butyrivibrio sp. FCS014 TaxID=1408304 RepID=UPI00046520BD|nr:glycoside hydrolase family 88 protein [Butyrivibrio sp. FCS014]
MIDSNQYMKLVETTATELEHIMEVSLTRRAKDFVKSALGRSVRTEDPMFWPAGMLMLGLTEARMALAGQDMVKRIDETIESHVIMWRDKYASKIDFIDDSLAGTALVKMYVYTGNELYKDAADKIYEFVMNAQRDPEGAIIYNSGKGNSNIFADGIGQTVMFLSAYGRAFNKADALSLAHTQLMNFRKYGMDARTGLCYHGYCIDNKVIEKKGLLGWGRAMGWLIMGLSEYCNGNVDINMASWYRDLSGIIESYVRSDGGFSWQIQAVEGHLDTSATGMLLYGIRAGDVTALSMNIDSNGRVGNALSSCDDFGVHYQSYGHYPWGQGAALAAISSAFSKQ